MNILLRVHQYNKEVRLILTEGILMQPEGFVKELDKDFLLIKNMMEVETGIIKTIGGFKFPGDLFPAFDLEVSRIDDTARLRLFSTGTSNENDFSGNSGSF